MSERIVPTPDIFTALAVGAPDGDPQVPNDPDLRPGVHLRLLPSPALGFPLAPFGIYKIPAIPVELTEGEVLWRDREGRIVQPELDAASGVLTADIPPPPDGAVYVAVELLTDGLDGRVCLLDRVDDRVVGVRSNRPFILAGPRVDRIRVEGHAFELSIRMWRIDLGRSLEPLIGAEPRLLGLPVDDDRPPWYMRSTGRDAALQRVQDAAPMRLGPPDRPDGPLDGVGSDNELARVLGFESPLQSAIETMLGDPAVLPSAQLVRSAAAADEHHPQQIVDMKSASALLAQAMDPGIGRYLGVVDYIPELPAWDDLAVCAAIGLFVVDAQATLTDGRRLSDAVGSFAPFVGTICERYAERIGVSDAIADLQARMGAQTLAVQGMIALAAVAPPPDPPEFPTPELAATRWLPSKDRPSREFRQDFVVSSPPLGSLLAVGRIENGEWQTRHELVELPEGADPPVRARAILLGRTRERPPFAARGRLTDSPLAADKENRYRFGLADLFGRFGSAVELDVPAPARPGPPTPAPQVDVVLDGPDGEGGPPASPGQATIHVPVSSVTERALGSLDIETLKLRLDGELVSQENVPKPEPGTIELTETSVSLPKLAVGAKGHSKLEAIFVDSEGVESQVAEVTVGYVDRRRPPTVPTAIGIYWTSRPGPSEEVELRLSWRGADGVGYRAYIADAKSLGLEGDSRAEVAAEGGQRALDHTLGGREHFRLLTEPPLTAIGGTVSLIERVPRALQTVQFLRIVPSTAGGREADFDSCPVVAVAVPSDRKPPPPRVEAELSASGKHSKITISAIGLDLVELRASEPGLFSDLPAADARPPTFRLRRAVGTVAAPHYAREVARGTLSRALLDGETVFAAQVDDPGALIPFVRYTYWAEVQMPPEKHLEAGVAEIPPAGGVQPAEPAQIQDLERLFSPASPPASILAKPPKPPEPLADAAATVANEGGQFRVTLTAPATPAADRNAIGPYRLRIWEQWDGGEITGAGPDIELAGAPLEWVSEPHSAAPQSATLHLVVIDPLGRESPLTAVDAEMP